MLFRSLKVVVSLLVLTLLALWPGIALAQEAQPINTLGEGGTFQAPTYWYLLAAALAFLVPVGIVLMSVAGLEGQRAWNAALGGVGAFGLATFGYWCTGFALQFGGIGLVYSQAALRNLVWEWSPLSVEWGIGWGMAGLSGWFLSGSGVTALNYALFLAHLPWVVTAAVLPVLALRGRAPATATFILALALGAAIYPLAGNWVQGGGWLSALGRNLNLGHGLVDFGGAGTVFLLAAGFGLAALVVWAPRRPRQALETMPLPPVYQPLLAVVGSLLVLAGAIGWLWANPLQVNVLGELALMRGSVNILLFASGGLLLPLAYTWFVTGKSDPVAYSAWLDGRPGCRSGLWSVCPARHCFSHRGVCGGDCALRHFFG
jgi:Amt family ammonium transporter